MKTEKPNQSSVLFTKIADMDIQSILDTGFFYEYETFTYIHSHSYFELFAAIEGELSIETSDGLPIRMPSGSVCLIPPNFYHCAFSVEEPCEKLVIRFNYANNSEPASDSVYNVCNSVLSDCRTPVVLNGCEPLCQLLCDLRSEINTPRLASDSLASLMLSQFYILLFRRLSDEKLAPAPVRYSHTKRYEVHQLAVDEYFSTHFSEPIAEEDMARELHISKRQLSRILRNIYGMSFRELLSTTRLKNAAHFLITTNYSVEKIAAMVGYTSLSGFYSAFKKQFSMTAGQYRRQFSK